MLMENDICARASLPRLRRGAESDGALSASGWEAISQLIAFSPAVPTAMDYGCSNPARHLVEWIETVFKFLNPKGKQTGSSICSTVQPRASAQLGQPSYF